MGHSYTRTPGITRHRDTPGLIATSGGPEVLTAPTCSQLLCPHQRVRSDRGRSGLGEVSFCSERSPIAVLRVLVPPVRRKTKRFDDTTGYSQGIVATVRVRVLVALRVRVPVRAGGSPARMVLRCSPPYTRTRTTARALDLSTVRESGFCWTNRRGGRLL